jgi:hypothetical protein
VSANWLRCIAAACRGFADEFDQLGDQPERKREPAGEGEPKTGRKKGKPGAPCCPYCEREFPPARMEGDRLFCFGCRKFFEVLVTGEVVEVPSGIDAG